MDTKVDRDDVPLLALQVAADAGHAYLAITDHGEDLAINGSNAEEMLAHRELIYKIQGESSPVICSIRFTRFRNLPRRLHRAMQGCQSYVRD